jgi:hypothetical protein
MPQDRQEPGVQYRHGPNVGHNAGGMLDLGSVGATRTDVFPSLHTARKAPDIIQAQ